MVAGTASGAGKSTSVKILTTNQLCLDANAKKSTLISPPVANIATGCKPWTGGINQFD